MCVSVWVCKHIRTHLLNAATFDFSIIAVLFCTEAAYVVVLHVCACAEGASGLVMTALFFYVLSTIIPPTSVVRQSLGRELWQWRNTDQFPLTTIPIIVY